MASDTENSLSAGLLAATTRNIPRIRRVRSSIPDFVPGRYDPTHKPHLPLYSKTFSDKILPTFRRLALYLMFYLVIATICFYFLRDHIKGEKINGILDSVYFSIVTLTTVGYGDLVPNSAPTKVLACAFIFLGMVLICLTLSKAADFLVQKQEIWIIKALEMEVEFGSDEFLKEIDANKAKYKCFMMLVFLVVLFVVGVVFLAIVEKLDVVDAFYCVFLTITTLGYGDKSFSTEGGRVFAVFWILISTICLAMLLCFIVELIVERRQKALVKYVCFVESEKSGFGFG